MIRACYPGSFDPLSNGHLDIIERISKHFDEVIILISNNIKKNYAFTANERKEMIEMCTKHLNNVKTVIYDGLVVKYCTDNKIDILIRGMRNIHDYENEFNLFQFNRDLAPNVETFLMLPSTKNQIVSSSAIKELVSFDSDISKYVPKELVELIKERFKH